jgi:transcription antitermination protein NusB
MPLTKADQRLRRRARARTLQALYAWDVAHGGSIAGVTARVWDDTALGSAERTFATPLIRTVEARGAEIDALLTDLTTNWRLERLGAIERAALRLGAAELMYPGSDERPPTPPVTVIQETVLLAERFGDADSARFVNGVLDAMARKLGRL